MTRSSITLEVGADLRIAVEPGEQRPVDADRSPLKASCPHEAGGVPRSNNEPTSPPNYLAPHPPATADGQSGIPSDPAAGAKSDSPHDAVVGRAGFEPGKEFRQGSQAVTHSRLAACPLPVSSEPQVTASAETAATDAPAAPPASVAQFKRTAADWRPHCKHPEACASYELKHCRACDPDARSDGGANLVHVHTRIAA